MGTQEQDYHPQPGVVKVIPYGDRKRWNLIQIPAVQRVMKAFKGEVVGVTEGGPGTDWRRDLNALLDSS